MLDTKWSVVLVGAGNVGYHLGKCFWKKGFGISCVFSRVPEKAARLAGEIGTISTSNLNNIPDDADLYILAVGDDAIEKVAAQLQVKKGLVVHTSGSTPSAVLQPFFERFGVFYPLQTFSISKPVDFTNIPICVYAQASADEDLLYNIGMRISSKVFRINDNQRTTLHVAAVFVNNFANYLFRIGYDIVTKEDIPFDLLRPLILETAEKVQVYPPSKMQTGPAIRGDEQTIQRHLAYLEKFPAYQKLYDDLTKNIQQL